MREADLKLDPSLTDTIASMLGINNIWRRIARLVEEKTGRQFTRFSFTDPQIDDAAKKELVFLLQGLRSRVGLDLRVAKREAQDMLGRELTEQEVGSILRQDVDKILKYAKHGHSKVKLGPEFEDKELVGRLYEAFRDVGNDLAAFTLAYHKKLDEYLGKGMIGEELYKRASLTPAKQYIQNLGKYVRTFYDKEKYVTGKNLYEPILHDFGLYTPSRLRKLTNEQMAIKYLKTLKQEGVAIAEGVPQELVDRVKNGDKEALDELGQVIREALGYITEGEKAIRKTTNYLTQNLYNLIIMDMIVNNKEFISEKQKEGFVKVVDKSLGILYGKWVRKDVYNDLVDGMRFVQETPDLLGIYSSLLKFSIVTARPGAWIRNITYASWVQQTLAGNSPLNPKNWQYFVKGTKEYLEVLSDARKASETFKLFNELGGGSGSYTTEEAIKLITFLEESGGLKDAKSFIRSLRDFANKGVSNLGEMYSHLDAIQKYVLFLKKLDDGLTPEEAVLYAQRYINNYALNPKFFRELSKSTVGSMLLPFISFTVANTPVLVESVVRYPHRMAMIIGAPYLAGKLFTILHPELRDQIEAQKPTHQKDNILYTSVGYDPETGKITYWDLSNFFNLPAYKPGKDLPIEIAKSLSGSFVMPGGLLSPLSTAITGKDVFGRDVELPYAEGRKGALANLLPGGLLMNEIKEVINSIEGKPYSSSGKVLTVPEALARFFGVNLTHTFPNQVMKNLNEINMKYGEKMAVYKRVVQDPYASEKEKAYALEQIAKLRDEKAQKQAEMVLPYIQSALKQKGENGALEQPTATVVDKPVNVVSGGGLVDLGKLGGGGSKSYRGSVKLKKVPKIPTTSFKLTSGLAPFQIVSTPSKKKKPRMISLDQLPISPLSNYRLR
ncbi:hypothetical protein D6779_10145 [Candidatus Parcubacteria bacterium]|nr:MAG: hypothetical protein D6779_10145 [Candidatus Parcubacteria bacterium]